MTFGITHTFVSTHACKRCECAECRRCECREEKTMPDFIITNHGSITTFLPVTPEAEAWWNEHVVEGQSIGRARAVEHRYAPDIVNGITEAGFNF